MTKFEYDKIYAVLFDSFNDTVTILTDGLTRETLRAEKAEAELAEARKDAERWFRYVDPFDMWDDDKDAYKRFSSALAKEPKK